ncbi:MAG: hypothetical protein MK008_08880 [Bdellovibrionales bacterium]|nr:hypothetical protein [Bdellovibrionales bacterium]
MSTDKKNLVAFRTTDNLTVYINPEQVGAIEVPHTSGRSEDQLRVYISGYKFNILSDLESFTQKLNIDLNETN